MSWPFSQIIEWAKVAQADRRPARPAPWYLPAAPPERFDELAERALAVAVGFIGCGEEGGNNRGPFVARCLEPDAVPPGNWCAAFAGLCYELAAAGLGHSLPFRRSLGAKRLGAHVAEVGRRFTDPAEVRPGDLMVFHRGAAGSWMGHVALVEEVAPPNASGVAIVYVVEGNAGPKVRRSARTTSKLDRFAFFASLRPAPAKPTR